MQLDGKRIVVTGGARGIGESAVRAFVREGALVAALDVIADRGSKVATEASDAGPGKAWFHRCDITQRTQVRAALADAVGELGGLDGIVNVAGIERSAPAEQIVDDDYDAIMNVNLKGTFITNQEAFPYLRDNGGGRIVNFASGAGLMPYPNGAHYSASKAGVMAWTRTVAHEWAKYRITANSVVPAMWTPMYDDHRARLSPEELVGHEALMAAVIPLGGRLGDPDTDLAPVLVFLMSDGSRFVTAQIMAVDGGMAALRG